MQYIWQYCLQIWYSPNSNMNQAHSVEQELQEKRQKL